MTDVSRETPSAPEVARRVFSSARLPLAEAYAGWLAGAGVVRGLIGPREVPRLWERHLLNCAVLGEAVPEGATVCDVGSGAGLPGLALAIARPDVEVVLLEPLLRRTTFLAEVVADLGLHGVEVVRGRAEEQRGRHFDVVTSRAVAPLDRLLGWSMPMVAGSGAMVALKGTSVAEEVERARPTLRRLGCAEPEILTLGSELLDAPTCAVRVAHADPRQVTWRDAPPRGTRNRSPRGRRRKG